MSVFTFQWPAMFLLLLGVVPLYALMRRARRKRKQVRELWGHGSTAPLGTNREVFWVLCYVALVLALARPSYDPVRHSISNTGRDVVFVLDVSRSMLARDTFPSRLESAKQGIEDCLGSLGTEQVGLVLYGGSASISCPLSSDYDFVRYMLSQVQPRSVEFGGTFLLSAVEKVVDQVLDPDRRGFQDLIVLTDGEDHAPDLGKVVERVRESGANLLVLGLGNPLEGAPIPIEKEDGTLASLIFEGETVYTTQQSEALADLAERCPDSLYVNAGVEPYHLGEIYRGFAEGKGTSAMDGDSGYTVYKEGAFYLLPLALFFAVLAHPSYWKGAFRFGFVLMAVGIVGGTDVSGQEEEFTLEVAYDLFAAAQYEQASLAFQSLRYKTGDSGAIAALSFNQGLADFHRSKQLGQDSAREALSIAQQARESFLLAARERPDFKRAKLRLNLLAGLIGELREAVAKEEALEEEEESLMQSLLEEVEALLLAQQELRSEVELADPIRSAPRRRRPAAAALQAVEPGDGGDLSRDFSRGQSGLFAEGQRIQTLMKDLNLLLAANAASAGPSQNVETVLSEPLVLMQQAIAAQSDAAGLLALWQNWPTGRARQAVAEKRLQEILDLFASSESDEGEEGDWEDYEDYEMGEDGEGMPSSIAMEGDLKSGAEMQALPLPNYSAEEIMMEEMGSQQFRQEQRAKSNAGQVKKDW